MEASIPRTVYDGPGVAFKAMTAVYDNISDFTLCKCRLKIF